jgi:hypothetical protein
MASLLALLPRELLAELAMFDTYNYLKERKEWKFSYGEMDSRAHRKKRGRIRMMFGWATCDDEEHTRKAAKMLIAGDFHVDIMELL